MRERDGRGSVSKRGSVGTEREGGRREAEDQIHKINRFGQVRTNWEARSKFPRAQLIRELLDGVPEGREGNFPTRISANGSNRACRTVWRGHLMATIEGPRHQR